MSGSREPGEHRERAWWRRARRAALVILIAVLLLFGGLIAALSVYLTDERVTELVVSTLNERLLGGFEIDSVSVSLTGGLLEVRGLEVRDPTGERIAAASRIEAVVSIRELLRNEVRIYSLSADGLNLRLAPPADPDAFAEPSAFSLQDAFRPADPAPTEEPGAEWRVDIRALKLDEIDLHLSTVDGLNVRVGAGELAKGQLGFSGDGLKVELSGAIDRLDVLIEDLSIPLRALSFEGVSLMMGPGADGRLDLGTVMAAYARPPSGPPRNLKARGGLTGMGLDADSEELGLGLVLEGGIDLSSEAVGSFLPEDLADQLSLRGEADLDLEIVGSTARPRVKGDFFSREVSVVGETLSLVQGGFEWENEALELTDLLLETGGGGLAGRISLDLSDEMEPGWAVDVELTDLPVGTLASAWTKAAADGSAEEALSIPKKVSGSIDAAGRGFETPSGRGSFDVRVSGLPAEISRGLPATLRARGGLRFDESSVRLEPLGVSGAGLSLRARGKIPFDDVGALDLDLRLRHDDPGPLLEAYELPFIAREVDLEARLEGSLSSPSAKGSLRVGSAGVEGIPMAALDVPFGFSEGTLSLEGARATIAGGAVTVSGSISLATPQLSFFDEPRLDLQVAASGVEIGSFVDDDSLIGSVSLTGRLQGTTSSPRGRARASIEGLRLEGVEVETAWAEVAADGDWVVVERLELTPRDGGGLEGSGRFHPEDQRIEARFEARNLPLELFAMLTEDGPPLSGRLDLEAAVSGSVEEPSIEARTRASDLRLDDTPVGSIDAEVRGDLTRLSVRAGLNLQAGEIDVRGWIAPNDEALEIAVTGQRLVVEDLPFASELEQEITGRLLLDLTLSGSFASPRLEGRAFARAIELDGVRFGDGTVDVTVRPSGPATHLLHVDLLGASQLEASVGLEPQLAITAGGGLDELSLAWLVPALAEHDLDAVLTGRVEVGYLAEPENIEVRLDLDSLSLSMGEEKLESRGPIGIGWDGSTMRLERLSLLGPNGSFEAHGDVGEALDLVARGSLEMELLTPFIADVGLATGTLDVDLSLTGSAEEPVVRGDVQISRAVRFRPRRMIREVEISAGRVHFEPGVLTLERLMGQVHGGIFRASGSVDLDGWEPEAYEISFSGQSIPLRTQELLLEANADLLLAGSMSRSELSGRVEVVRGRYMEKFELAGFVFRPTRRVVQEPLVETVPMLADIDLDLRVISLGAMEIRADAGAFSLDMVLDADLRVGGTAAEPVLDGRVEASRGGLQFPRARLDVARSNIEFVPRPGEAIRPEIDLRAEGEVTPAGAGDAGQTTYFITLILDGDLDEMLLDLSSDPTLDRLEILSLLVTGRRPADHLGGAAGSQADAAMVFAGSQLAEPLTRFVTSQLESHLNLELDLSAEVSTAGLMLVAGTEITRRLRFEWAFQRGFAGDAPASSAARARYLLSDRVFLEGTTESAVGQASSSAAARDGARSRLELKLRIFGT